MALISPPTDKVFKFNFGSAPPIERDDSIRRSTQGGESQYELLDDQSAACVFGGESDGTLGGGG